MRRSRAPPTVAPVWKMFRRKVPIFYKLPPHAADQMRWFLCFLFVFLCLYFFIFVLFCCCIFLFLYCLIFVFLYLYFSIFFAFSCFFAPPPPLPRIRWEKDHNFNWICHCNFCLVVCNCMIWKNWLLPIVYQQIENIIEIKASSLKSHIREIFLIWDKIRTFSTT